MLNWTNFQPNRAHWLVGFPILVAFEGIGGVITLGTWGGGVLVSPKFCKFKVLDTRPPVYMHPSMHTPSYEGTPPVVDAPSPVYMCPGMHTPSYEGTPKCQ